MRSPMLINQVHWVGTVALYQRLSETVSGAPVIANDRLSQRGRAPLARLVLYLSVIAFQQLVKGGEYFPHNSEGERSVSNNQGSID